MRAIILAAGMGRRLGAGVPKCLLDVGGASIVHRQLQAFRAGGVNEFIIVVGYQQDEVRSHLGGEHGQFTFIVNDRYGETNTIYSLYLAREHFGQGMFYANGDVLFDQRLIDRLAEPSGRTGLAVKPGRCGQEEVKVVVRDGRIVRIGKQLDPAQSLGEFVGVAWFGGDIVGPLADMLRECVEKEGIVGDHFERAVDRLCRGGHPLQPVEVSDLPCGEIDFPEDLAHARAEILPRLS